MLVNLDDLLQPCELVPIAFMADRGRERIGDGLYEFCGLQADVLNVAVGAGYVGTLEAAVVEVRGRHRVVRSSSQLAGGGGWIEDAGHAPAVVDLQARVAEEIASLAVPGQDAASELAASRRHPVAVGVGCRAADVLTRCEGLFVLGQALHAEQPVLEGVFIRKAGLVYA
ncbi:hypothetical protein ACFXG9_13665 [Streptomyces mirabilis]|uniref:hypothetical protein n=1 Tax=Streptomyces mirabilis TaxID=68239 RepID=UPI0036BB0A9B